MKDQPRTALGARLRPLAAVASIALGAALLTACSGDSATDVTTAKAARGDVVEVVDAAGSIVARASSTVTAAAGGTVEALGVADGQQVKVGQVLLRLRSPQAVSALEQAESADESAASGATSSPGAAGLSAAQRRSREQALAGFADARAQAAQITDLPARTQALAALDQARAQYDLLTAQTDELVGQVNAGLRSVDAAVRSLTQAQRLQTRAAVAAAQSVVDSLVVRAPIAGRVSFGTGAGGSAGGGLPAGADALLRQSGVDLGAAAASGAGAGTTPGATTLAVGTPVGSGATLATITDASVLTVTADVDETDVLRLKAGTKADVTVDAVPAATYTATVRSIDPAPTTGTAGSVTYTARMSFDGGRIDGRAAPDPLPGMSAVVSLRVAQVRDAVRVPPSAVVRSGGGGTDAVWVVTAGRARLRPVTVGLRGDDAVQLTRGVSSGDTIVVEGMADLTEGDQVR